MDKLRNAPGVDDESAPPGVDVIVGLGANLGDIIATLSAARRGLGALPGTSLIQASSLYRTAPVGREAQPDFVNAVCWLKTTRPAADWAAGMFALERGLGRVRTGPRDEPRVIDLDLLYYEGVVAEGPELSLPHPRLHQRAFVLYPWVEIMPGFVLPGRGALMDLCHRLRGQRIERMDVAW